MKDRQSLTPFAGLTPDAVLNAAEEVGLEPDGHVFALNSYENRVYRLGCVSGPPVVLKFYRSGRWSDAQILEEHAFASELAAAEIPVVAPLPLGEARCAIAGNFAWRHFRCAPAARPTLISPEPENCWAAPSGASMPSALFGPLRCVRRCARNA